jgi:hypothetical protein
VTCGCSPFTPPAPGEALFRLSNTFFVDEGTLTPLAQQDGKITSPFATLSQAFAVAPPGTTIVLTEGSYGTLSLDNLSVTIVSWSNANLGNVTLTNGASLYLENISVGALTVTDSSIVLVNCLPFAGIDVANATEASFDLLTLGRMRTFTGSVPFAAQFNVRDAPTVRTFLTLPALTAPDAADITIPFDLARPGDTFSASGVADVNPWPAAAILGQPRCETNDEVIVPIMTITTNVAALECGIVVTQFPVARSG